MCVWCAHVSVCVSNKTVSRTTTEWLIIVYSWIICSHVSLSFFFLFCFCWFYIFDLTIISTIVGIVGTCTKIGQFIAYADVNFFNKPVIVFILIFSELKIFLLNPFFSSSLIF